MNVFVLCTGRCGSTTFARAAEHATNFSVGHESRKRLIGADRFAYPDNHIEVDNRLSWMLGRLDDHYGETARYVHLTREREAVARSFLQRWDRERSIIKAYQGSILAGSRADPLNICHDYIDTVTSNIGHFLAGKPHVANVAVETGKADFERFWHWIGAEGDFPAALAEWDVRHNPG